MKRVVLLSDEEIDRILDWYDSAYDEGNDVTDEGQELAEKLRKSRLP